MAFFIKDHNGNHLNSDDYNPPADTGHSLSIPYPGNCYQFGQVVEVSQIRHDLPYAILISEPTKTNVGGCYRWHALFFNSLVEPAKWAEGKIYTDEIIDTVDAPDSDLVDDLLSIAFARK